MLTCTSSVFVEPNQFTSQTSSISRSRVTTVPASCISSASRSNSLRASSTGAPFSVAVRFAGSSRTLPISIGPSPAPAGVLERRSTARIRAITSRALNGLTT